MLMMQMLDHVPAVVLWKMLWVSMLWMLKLQMLDLAQAVMMWPTLRVSTLWMLILQMLDHVQAALMWMMLSVPGSCPMASWRSESILLMSATLSSR